MALTKDEAGAVAPHLAGRKAIASGPGEVLQLIRSGTARTRRDIQEITAMSRVTVAQRVSFLAESELIRERGDRATGGRRAQTLEFNIDHSVVLCAAIDTRHARTAITRLDGEVIAESKVAVTVADGPEPVLESIDTAFARLLASIPGRRPRIGAVAVSVPGPVDPQTRRPSQPPIMPGWDAYPIADKFGDVYGAPVFVENDADAMAAGEQARNFPTCPSLCLIKVSTGIGAGIVVDGHVYHGIDGGAGDIGHIRIPGVDAVCQCGSTGCLAATASGGAIARQLRHEGVHVESGRDLRALLKDGNIRAAALTHEAGKEIGAVLATLVSTLNPGVLLVAGDLASSHLLGGIRETLYPRSLPRATRNLDVRLSTLGSHAGITGLTHIAVDEVYSAARTDQAYETWCQTTPST